MRRLFVVTWLLAALLAALSEPVRGEEPDPWKSLETLRSALATDGQLSAGFEESYVPAGFSSGDTESGSVDLSIPDCLRWDYTEPYRKSFLVCGDRAWSWVEGEPRGQRYTIQSDREMGLDLLLLPSAELAKRYKAKASNAPGGEIEIELEPLVPEEDIVAANLRLAADGRRPVALDWRDKEGNVTSFRFRDWRRVDQPSLFDPPAAMEWSQPSAAAPGLR